jgi:hypothetical protein
LLAGRGPESTVQPLRAQADAPNVVLAQIYQGLSFLPGKVCVM